MFHIPDESPLSVHCGRYRPGNYRRRRGVAVFLVLLLITLTLVISYAAVRTQNMAFMVQRNSDRRAVAQQTAVTGMTMALKKMQNSSWAGFGSTLTGTLSTSESFTATYTFGDASLTSSSSDYNDYPFRGTISVTGKSIDPVNTQNVSTYQISAVVRLVPRQLSTEPSDWSTMQQFMVYQTHQQPFEIDIPCQMSGSVRIQGALKIAPNYPDTSDSWVCYLSHLNSMRSGGYSDDRPFTGTVRYVSSTMDGTELTALTGYLGVTASSLTAATAGSDWTQPSGFSTYQIYPGGPTYSIPLVSNNLQSVTLGPDPLTNPLGIFYYAGSLTIKSGVTIKGSLFCKNSLTLDGANISFEPVELPGLFGAGTSIRLPAIICNNLTVNSTVSSSSIKGLVAVFNTFTIAKASELQTFAITGRVISKIFYIKERLPWNTISWTYYYYYFWLQRYSGIPYFPVYMGNYSRNPKPLLTIQPDTTSITYHWPTPNASVLAINSIDGALRWEIVKWTETP
ncbi:MAG: hypothetical protein ABSA26_09365 [Thermoguttaceae bacterium]